MASNPFDKEIERLIRAQNSMPPPNFNSYSTFSINTPNFMPRKLYSRGTRVVLMKGCGIDPDESANPIWGKNKEYISGTVENDSGDQTIIRWDNGMRNAYDHSIGGFKIVTLEEAPKSKGVFAPKVELDSTKLDVLVIKPDVKAEIVAVLQQHKHSKKIFDDWGLGAVIEYGRGMTLMFWGEPGTGKTFGARCIAKSLGKELLVISAAEIQSSEPGGANRNIQKAFKAAKEKNSVLFIDECDSLISNRANLGMILASEINTLLTEIEKSESVVILATNRIEDMDPALERRLSLIIEFPKPTFEQRVDIWKGLLPPKMPVSKDVKLEDLAKHELTGGLIKNVVLQAARLAISEDAKEVSSKYFNKAIERTVSSQGLMGKERIQTGKKRDYQVGVGTGVDYKIDVDRDKVSDFLDDVTPQ